MLKLGNRVALSLPETGEPSKGRVQAFISFALSKDYDLSNTSTFLIRVTFSLLSNMSLFAVSKPCLFKDSIFFLRFLGRRRWGRGRRGERGKEENWKDREER